MQLLSEKMTWDQAKIITEGGGSDSTGKKKDLYLSGVFIQGSVQNHNRRIYPAHEISSAVAQLNDSIARGETLWGEADHPEGLSINLDRISHMITEIKMSGQDGIGKLKIIDTPMGNICRTLVECGGKLGVSSRGSGDVNESTGEVSQYEIITVDIVARPSAPEAFPQPIYEALNMRRGAIVEDLAIAMKHDPRAQEHLAKELVSWINALK